MNRHEAIRSPDSFELEAAARYHRTEVWGEAFDAAAEWIILARHGGEAAAHFSGGIKNQH